jgi:uncharacterized protein
MTANREDQKICIGGPADGASERIAVALEKLAGAPPAVCDFDAADAFVFAGETTALVPVHCVNRVDLVLLRGIDQARDTLLANTERFARGFAANNALLWGARGMGKSALVKAVHASINARLAGSQTLKPLKLIEIHREDIEALPRLMALLRREPLRFVVFCDDLSFDAADTSYKSLKAALEGGIEGRPANVLFYATSNRRHILPREMIEYERGTAINPDDAVQEKISLSDRFGLWLGFHACSQEDYLAMVLGYAKYFDLGADRAAIEREALEWAMGALVTEVAAPILSVLSRPSAPARRGRPQPDERRGMERTGLVQLRRAPWHARAFKPASRVGPSAHAGSRQWPD